MDEPLDLPYRAEYAKSGRAACRGCKSPIAKDTLRLAVMVQVRFNVFLPVLHNSKCVFVFTQSPMFDGKTPQWYHFHCFFSKQRPKTVDDIHHFESLRWDDQEKIKEKIRKYTIINLKIQRLLSGGHKILHTLLKN